MRGTAPSPMNAKQSAARNYRFPCGHVEAAKPVDARRLGRLPTLQRRRDRRGTQAVKACAIITSQPSQVAVTGVVTVRQLSGCQGLESSKQGRNQGTVATRSGSSAAT